MIRSIARLSVGRPADGLMHASMTFEDLVGEKSDETSRSPIRTGRQHARAVVRHITSRHAVRRFEHAASSARWTGVSDCAVFSLKASARNLKRWACGGSSIRQGQSEKVRIEHDEPFRRSRSGGAHLR